MYYVGQSDTVDRRSPLPPGQVLVRPTFWGFVSYGQCLGSSLSTVSQGESRLNLRIVCQVKELRSNLRLDLGSAGVTQSRQHKLCWQIRGATVVGEAEATVSIMLLLLYLLEATKHPVTNHLLVMSCRSRVSGEIWKERRPRKWRPVGLQSVRNSPAGSHQPSSATAPPPSVSLPGSHLLDDSKQWAEAKGPHLRQMVFQSKKRWGACLHACAYPVIRPHRSLACYALFLFWSIHILRTLQREIKPSQPVHTAAVTLF